MRFSMFDIQSLELKLKQRNTNVFTKENAETNSRKNILNRSKPFQPLLGSILLVLSELLPSHRTADSLHLAKMMFFGG